MTTNARFLRCVLRLDPIKHYSSIPIITRSMETSRVLFIYRSFRSPILNISIRTVCSRIYSNFVQFPCLSSRIVANSIWVALLEADRNENWSRSCSAVFPANALTALKLEYGEHWMLSHLFSQEDSTGLVHTVVVIILVQIVNQTNLQKSFSELNCSMKRSGKAGDNLNEFNQEIATLPMGSLCTLSPTTRNWDMRQNAVVAYSLEDCTNNSQSVAS